MADAPAAEACCAAAEDGQAATCCCCGEGDAPAKHRHGMGCERSPFVEAVVSAGPVLDVGWGATAALPEVWEAEIVAGAAERCVACLCGAGAPPRPATSLLDLHCALTV